MSKEDIEVRELEWKFDEELLNWESKEPVSLYMIGIVWETGENELYYCTGFAGHLKLGVFKTEDEAKAFAQDHFKELILNQIILNKEGKE